MNTNNKRLALEMHIDDLAHFLFVRNENNVKVDLELHGIHDVKDLFCFCIDLLCKGMVYVCRKDGSNKVNLDEITAEEISKVIKKLKCSGIVCHLNISQNEEASQPKLYMSKEFDDPNEKELARHFFHVITSKNKFDVNFEIV